MGCLYKLTSPSGKSYIGITVQTLHARMRAHRSAARAGRGGYLYAAMRKYGPRSFAIEKLVDADDWEELQRLEVGAIVAHGTKAPRGYNLTDGGDGVPGVIISEECRAKRSRSQKLSFADPERKARHLASQNTEECKRLRAEAAKRNSADPELRARLSEMMKARWQDPAYRAKLLAKPRGPKPLNDGLNKWQRYRLKDLSAYRKSKREYAKNPAERERRRLYMLEWRKAHPGRRPGVAGKKREAVPGSSPAL